VALVGAELALRRVRVGDAAVALDRAMTTLEGRSKRRTHEHSSLLPDSDAGPIQRSSARVVVAPWTGNRRLDRPQRNAGPASQVPRLCRGVRGACNRSWHLHVSRCASADAASALTHRVVGVRCDKALAALHSARSRHPMGKRESTMKSLNGIRAVVTGGATAAFDKQTAPSSGRPSYRLGGNATPSTYMRDDRQFVVISAGGGNPVVPPAAASSRSHSRSPLPTKPREGIWQPAPPSA